MLFVKLCTAVVSCMWAGWAPVGGPSLTTFGPSGNGGLIASAFAGWSSSAVSFPVYFPGRTFLFCFLPGLLPPPLPFSLARESLSIAGITQE